MEENMEYFWMILRVCALTNPTIIFIKHFVALPKQSIIQKCNTLRTYTQTHTPTAHTP